MHFQKLSRHTLELTKVCVALYFYRCGVYVNHHQYFQVTPGRSVVADATKAAAGIMIPETTEDNPEPPDRK